MTGYTSALRYTINVDLVVDRDARIDREDVSNGLRDALENLLAGATIVAQFIDGERRTAVVDELALEVWLYR